MTEIIFNSGGRPYNNQDFRALQELSIDVTEVFNGYSDDDYVVSGANSPGINNNGDFSFVWLGKKLRRVPNDTLTSFTYPVYIIATSEDITRLYKDGVSRKVFTVYDAIWSDIAPVGGEDFIIFNDLNDLNNKRLSNLFLNGVVPQAGGTFEGFVNFEDGLWVNGNGVADIGPSLFYNTTAPDYIHGIGFNARFQSNLIKVEGDPNNAYGGIVFNHDGGNMAFITNPSDGSGDVDISVNVFKNQAKMVLYGTGNLGLGTTFSESLTSSHRIRLRGTSEGQHVHFVNTNAATGILVGLTAGGNGEFNIFENKSIYLKAGAGAGNKNIMSVHSDSNVIIGASTTTTARLKVDDERTSVLSSSLYVTGGVTSPTAESKDLATFERNVGNTHPIKVGINGNNQHPQIYFNRNTTNWSLGVINNSFVVGNNIQLNDTQTGNLTNNLIVLRNGAQIEGGGNSAYGLTIQNRDIANSNIAKFISSQDTNDYVEMHNRNNIPQITFNNGGFLSIGKTTSSFIIRDSNSVSVANNYFVQINTDDISTNLPIRSSAAGQLLHTEIYSDNLGDSLSTILIPSNTITTIYNITYTPKSSSSYIIVEFDADYRIQGGGSDTAHSIIEVGVSTVVDKTERLDSSRSNKIFPVVGMYENTNTVNKAINIRTYCSNDIMDFLGVFSLKVTEIAR